MRTVIIILSLVLLPAHSWYPTECCSSKDCFVIVDPKEVSDDGENYIYKGMSFPKKSSKVSPDGHYHACIEVSMVSRLRCFWRPMTGV